MKKWILCLLCALLVCTAAFAEDEEISLEDTAGIIIEEITYDDVPWIFPVDIFDMNPTYIVLANKQVLLDEDFVPEDLVTMKTRKENKAGENTNGGVLKASSSEMQLAKVCAEALVEMSEAAMQDGYKLYLKSAYRSYRTQKTMYYNRLEKNNGKDDGWVAKPGSSDHQTGLGCDVVPRSWRDKSMNEKMGKEPECQWMAENCHRFGFILRYPSDKEDVTEINYEPWHMRYVGIPAATYIMENGLTLEEFHEELKTAIDLFLESGGNPALVQDFLPLFE
ncbi:MAG: M15 family metallopeptidase [Clostridia bacterium]|nr:M15 family metallopeptidase [Clostridia bacterium]